MSSKDKKTETHAVFGSAGMAASGMIRTKRKKRKTPELSHEEAVESRPVSEEGGGEIAPIEAISEIAPSIPTASSDTDSPVAADTPVVDSEEDSAELGLSSESPSASTESTESFANESIADPEVGESEFPEDETTEPRVEEAGTATLDAQNPEPESLTPFEEAPLPTDEEVPEPSPEAVVKSLRAAVIGHTNAGEYGHGLDILFQNLPGVRFVGIADSDPEGLDAAQLRTGAERAYADYHEMLATEQPDLVAIGPRETGERYAMVKAALEAGAHVCCERPIARTLREADELLSLAAEKGLKLAVLHPMRCDPHVRQFLEEREKLIGDLLEIKVFGMMDARAGGEDLLVLGTHLFDLVRLFAGEISHCSATITKDGLSVIADDFHFSEKEDLGPLLGDSIHAAFYTESGVHVSYVSDRRLHYLYGPWGLEFIGTLGIMRLFAGQPPTLSLLIEDNPASPERSAYWETWPKGEGDYHASVDGLSGNDAANRLVVHDWLAAIAEDRAPICSGENAMKALEVVHSVWWAGATMKRAYFPLTNRLHPLEGSE